MKRSLITVIVLAALALTGCPSNNQVTLPPPGSSPIQRLYVANDDSSGVLDIFAPPFSGASTPAVAFQVPSATDVDDVAFDSNNRVYVGDFSHSKIDVFASPITNASTALFSIPLPNNPEGIDVDASGNLYVAVGGSEVLIFDAPLSVSSTAAVTIAQANPIGVKLDSGGNLYVVRDGTSINIFHPPFSNSSTPAVTFPFAGAWGLLLDKATGNIWATSRSAHSVAEFVPPFSNASSPTLTIASGLTDPSYPALDSAGNLYVGDFAGAVRVYNAPLSNASTAAFSISAPDPNGIRFGP